MPFRICILSSDAAGSARTVEDVTPYWDQKRTSLNVNNGTKKTGDKLGLKIPTRIDLARSSSIIWSRGEVWAGNFEDGAWLDDGELWGGFIRMAKVYRVAGMTYYDLTLDTYDLLLKTTILPAYPDQYTLERQYHSPPQPTDVKIVGYQYDVSHVSGTPYDWMAGRQADGKPADGIVRMFLDGTGYGGKAVDLGGILNASPWSDVLFDETSRPSNTVVLGHLEGLFLDQALDLIMSYTALLQQATHNRRILPVYYLRAIPDPDDSSELIPQFVAKDLLDYDSADVFFSDDPADELASGAVLQWKDYVLEMDYTDVYTSVGVLGKGSWPAGSDTYGPLYRRIWSLVHDHATNGNPLLNGPLTTYQTVPGWATIHIDDNITDLTVSANLAKQISEAVWQFKYRAHLKTYHPIQRGQIVRVKHRPSQGPASTGMSFPVIDVTKAINAEGGRFEYSIELGWQTPSMQDILSGPNMRLIELLARGIKPNPIGKGPNFLNPNLPPRRETPIASENFYINDMTAQHDGTPAMRMRAAISRRKITPDGQPISEDNFNYVKSAYVNAGGVTSSLQPLDTFGEPTDRPIPGESIIPMPMFPVYDGLGNIVQWFDVEGNDHPQHHTYVFVGDDFEPIVFPTPVILSTVRFDAEYNESAVLIANASGVGAFYTGMSVALRKYDATIPGMADVDPVVSKNHPLYIGPSDYVTLHVAGMAPGHKVSVLVSEEGASDLLYPSTP